MKLLLILAISSILGITNVSTEEPQASIDEPPPLEAPIKPVIKEKKKAVSKPAPKPKMQEKPPSTPEPVIIAGDCDLVEQYDWPIATAKRICFAESGGNVAAINWNDNHGSCKGSYSLMQVGCIHYYSRGLTPNTDPNLNMKIAYEIWKQQGFHPWSTY
jgi:hypothetical protein